MLPSGHSACDHMDVCAAVLLQACATTRWRTARAPEVLSLCADIEYPWSARRAHHARSRATGWKEGSCHGVMPIGGR